MRDGRESGSWRVRVGLGEEEERGVVVSAIWDRLCLEISTTRGSW